ncbi:AraC family transcriptional regulator [Clostridium estertheticum]|uniref:AraC family transcriptional regulator n=1 Tax=Clostridium estertheticum TaxID=238834 RepID=UPI001CF4AE13|nr:AraC family transcriptional regulator [Clostridium estertheticum]MCB2305480.1 AraC family transcriptional regulator [Clostridium estertheticum]MCB2343919.1 AraC family transcriptional regulator [Clostridium estertheticum]MCB2348836.1 AraC family transcriptional regulator [Clostridium estertheticum]WAG46156.1 AraC family transcriptional regulator [Clostridium estertheticum]
MNIKELDKKLKQLNDIEKNTYNLYNTRITTDVDIRLKEHFSNKVKNDLWIINNEKLMNESEVIAIHKHDRFIKFDKHKHDYLEMMFVYSGKINQVIEGGKIVIEKGEILLLDMNVEHSIEAAGFDDIAINVLIKKEFFDWIFMSQIADNDLISNFIVEAIYGKNKFKQYIHFKTSENDKVCNFMIQILMEYYDKKNGMETAIRAYMMLLFNELLRDYKKYLTSEMVSKIDSTISTEILNYINKNYKIITLKSMADHFSYNPDYIGKLVKKIIGKTLTELVKEKKIKQAEYLLHNTKMSVIDVITEVGYSNVSYFYRQFKDQVGVTPDEYRKK